MRAIEHRDARAAEVERGQVDAAIVEEDGVADRDGLPRAAAAA